MKRMIRRKKQCLLLLICMLVLVCGCGQAESNVWSVAEKYLEKAMDLPGIGYIESSAPEYSNKELEFWFDFRDGWQCVMMMHDRDIHIARHAAIDEQALINGFHRTLELLPQIQAEVPGGVQCSLVVAFGDGRICEIVASER